MDNKRTVLSAVAVCIVSFLGLKAYGIYSTYSLINKTLEDNNWMVSVKESKHEFDIKRAVPYKTIIFKDEPNSKYEFECDADNKVYSIGWDKNGNPLEKTDKYIIN